jgi:hypothetical protein
LEEVLISQSKIHINMIMTMIFGLTSPDSSINNPKVNTTKMAPKKEVRLDKVHILQESELFEITKFNSNCYII